MKVSISLPDDDVALLDELARSPDYESRSAVVQHAVAMLRQARLGEQYAQAWADWEISDDAAGWESTVADGMNAP